MFAVPQYGDVFQAVIDCVDSGDPVDVVAVTHRLNGQPGADWDETIRDVLAVGDPAHTLFYAR